ncbi:hypothetical protein ACN262_06840 [Burkholderia gladioli]|uniref:hypothetical protein n=1 Tax=Burkholderia gladioli TaxID=28095 RepID=UPI0016420576|nr:hypothetical protein [Burkholderia gladioli]URV28683.1 hypothetical protein NAL90_21030 [Burkholderia gladioli]
MRVALLSRRFRALPNRHDKKARIAGDAAPILAERRARIVARAPTKRSMRAPDGAAVGHLAQPTDAGSQRPI